MHNHNNAAHSTHTAFDRASVLRFLIAPLFALLLLDVVLTVIGITLLGAIEMNPLMEMMGLFGFMLFKVAVTMIVPLFLIWFGRKNLRETIIGCLFLVGLYSVVLVNNLYVLAVMM